MINIDKVIDDFNENELPKKVVDYYQVIDDKEIPKGETTVSSTNGESYTINLSDNKGISCMEIPSEGLNTNITTINTTDLYEYAIKEHDQVRTIKFKANSLLEQLNLPLLEEDKDIELKCLIEGRNCDRYGNAVNVDYE